MKNEISYLIFARNLIKQQQQKPNCLFRSGLSGVALKMLGLCVCACDQAEAFEHRELSQCLVDLENLRYHSAGENFQLIMN